MGSGVGGMLRSTNKKLSPMITPQIHLVHDAIRAMLWDAEFYFHGTLNRGIGGLLFSIECHYSGRCELKDQFQVRQRR